MRENFNNLEKGMKESLNDFELPFDSKHWEELEMRLEGKSASSLSTMAAAVVTALILMSGITYVLVTAAINDSTQGISKGIEDRSNFSLNALDYNDMSGEIPLVLLDDNDVSVDESHPFIEGADKDVNNSNKDNLIAEVQSIVQENKTLPKTVSVIEKHSVEVKNQLEQQLLKKLKKMKHQ